MIISPVLGRGKIIIKPMTYYEGKEAVTRESDYTDLMHASVCTRIHSKKMCAQEASLYYTLVINIVDGIRTYRHKR